MAKSKILNMDDSLFTDEAIEEAVDAFSGVAAIRVAPGDSGRKLKIVSRKGYDADLVAWEFGNYVIARTVEKARGEDGDAG
ncbi:MAG: hypothetical protein GXP49_02125 [Deltaproteobacteria bacterium]|nr:hypothetical protein [Deltaproteobacteria bacterium]